MHFDVVIVGAGHGGAQVAVMLRTQQFAGSIAIVGDEPELPYERPPLSKEYFAGEKEFERIQLRPARYWDAAQRIASLANGTLRSFNASQRQLFHLDSPKAVGPESARSSGRFRSAAIRTFGPEGPDLGCERSDAFRLVVLAGGIVSRSQTTNRHGGLQVAGFVADFR